MPWLAIAGMLVVACLSGCGGEYAGRTEGDAVSGSAVSGDAVSGQAVSGGAVSDPVVSGPALQDEGTENFVSEKKKSKYRFCNDSHLYYMENRDDFIGKEGIIDNQLDTTITEYNLSDGSCREIKFEKKKDRVSAICYVDNDWVWYLKEIEDGEYQEYQDEIWRAPVENGKLNVRKEEFVFSDPELVINKRQIYCDGRYLLYTADDSSDSYYRKYDLKEKKYIYKQYNKYNAEGEVDSLVAVAGGAAFVDGYDGLFRQDLDSSEKIFITESFDDVRAAVTETDLFYLGDELEADCTIWQYHLEDGSKKKIITDEQIWEVLKTQGLLKSGKRPELEADIFVSGDRLYVQVDLSREERGMFVYNMVVLSQKIGSRKGLRYEKRLTECLSNPKKSQKKFDKIYGDPEEEYKQVEPSLYLSRGCCMEMIGKKCFMFLYDPEQDKNRVACYDLSSGSMKFLTKKDPDWYLPFYNGSLGLDGGYEQIDGEYIYYHMPNNKRVSWPYWELY